MCNRNHENIIRRSKGRTAVQVDKGNVIYMHSKTGLLVLLVKFRHAHGINSSITGLLITVIEV